MGRARIGREQQPDPSLYTPTVKKYRFLTTHRNGKWYSDIHLAQQGAAAIGAGFLDVGMGRFVACQGTRLEVAHQA
jgi:hypothetical protein